VNRASPRVAHRADKCGESFGSVCLANCPRISTKKLSRRA
jgi:hypothetical protein